MTCEHCKYFDRFIEPQVGHSGLCTVVEGNSELGCSPNRRTAYFVVSQIDTCRSAKVRQGAAVHAQPGLPGVAA